jgi:hypothetical protein
MAAKDIRFSSDARDRMLRGVETLANAIDALASLALFWLRFPAARRSPRLRRIEVERR